MTNLLPQSLKLKIRLLIRHFRDLRSGDAFRFATTKRPDTNLPCQVKVIQIPVDGTFKLPKIYNLRKVARLISVIEIRPNEVFSFYKIVGKVSRETGYEKGRNLVNGEIQEEYGGGLCQMTGILYHTALLAGLEIKERHNHSVDIYTEEERYTPLGSDATIVYGYKDFRFVNNKDHSIRFRFEARPERFVCELLSEAPISERKIEFIRSYEEGGVKVETIEIEGDQDGKTIDTSWYGLMKALPDGNKNL